MRSLIVALIAVAVAVFKWKIVIAIVRHFLQIAKFLQVPGRKPGRYCVEIQWFHCARCHSSVPARQSSG